MTYNTDENDTRFSLIQDHFEETQYENRRADNLKRLKPFALPTIFTSTTSNTTTTTETTSPKASKRARKARNCSRIKPERLNPDEKKNSAQDASQTPLPCVFTEHSYSNTVNEAKLEGIASRSSECVAGNGFKIDKVSKPDFTNADSSFLPSRPVPDASFSFPSSSSSFGHLSSPAFTSSFSGKDEEMIVKREENFDIDTVDSVSPSSSHYSYYCGKKVKEEKMVAVSEDAVKEFLCGSNDSKIPIFKMPQPDASNDEPLFTFVGISPHGEEKPSTRRDSNCEAEREGSPLLCNTDNSRSKKVTDLTHNITTNDVNKAASIFVQSNSAPSLSSGQNEEKMKREIQEIEYNFDSNTEVVEAEDMIHLDDHFETGNHHENEGLQDPRCKVMSLTKSSATLSSFCPNDDRLAKMEQRMAQLEKSLFKQRRMLHKLKRHRKRQAHMLGKVFTKDQLASLGRKCRRGVKWSKETIRKALLLLSACRPSGYKALLTQKLPLPSLGLLRRLKKS